MPRVALFNDVPGLLLPRFLIPNNPEDENLDQICKRKLRELEELNQFHINKANELRKFEEDNLKLRDRLEEEVSETVIEKLFQQNFQLIEVNIAP